MSSSSPKRSREQRPEFMIKLGLIPPYSVEDVKQAYLEKVKAAHPDHGGDTADFVELHKAFEQATKYAEIRKSRMKWIGSQMEHYIAQDAVIQHVKGRGGTVDVEQLDWLEKSFGTDFAQVVEQLTGIHLCGPKITDDDLDYLVMEHSVLGGLRLLDLSGSRISDGGLRRLGVLSGLKELDLRDTQITGRGLEVLRYLPDLERLSLRGAKVGWFARRRLHWKYSSVRVEA